MRKFAIPLFTVMNLAGLILFIVSFSKSSAGRITGLVLMVISVIGLFIEMRRSTPDEDV